MKIPLFVIMIIVNGMYFNTKDSKSRNYLGRIYNMHKFIRIICATRIATFVLLFRLLLMSEPRRLSAVVLREPGIYEENEVLK